MKQTKKQIIDSFSPALTQNQIFQGWTGKHSVMIAQLSNGLRQLKNMIVWVHVKKWLFPFWTHIEWESKQKATDLTAKKMLQKWFRMIPMMKVVEVSVEIILSSHPKLWMPFFRFWDTSMAHLFNNHCSWNNLHFGENTFIKKGKSLTGHTEVWQKWFEIGILWILCKWTTEMQTWQCKEWMGSGLHWPANNWEGNLCLWTWLASPVGTLSPSLMLP